MPYISIKSFPKDDETKKAVVEKINEIFLTVWGCPQHAITISIEEVAPEDWEKTVAVPEIELKKDKMMILSGEKCYDK